MENTDINASGSLQLTIRGEAQMADCAAALAQVLRGNECILLSGTLGTGKTTLARALIRQFCGADTEVVSPSFMILQQYDILPEKGGGMIHHYDLYRLEHAEELWELGLEEALGQALVLVEWPQLADGFWPPDRLEITLHHEAQDNAQRRLQLLAHGDMVAAARQFFDDWNRRAHD